jgi:peptide/nickel transport system permease protein
LVTQYIIRRLLQTVLVLLGVSVVAFGVMFLAGDPVLVMSGEDWTQEEIDDFRHQMGFDRPWYVQYAEFLSHAVRGDLGVSLRQRQPNLQLVMDRMPATLELALAAMFISIFVAIPVGVLSATRRGTWVDNVSMLVAMLGQSMPIFWLGIMLILVFSVWLRLTPVSGRGSWQNLILPAITLGAFITARNARMMRSSMLEVLEQDYIRTARAKGLGERAVLYRHAIRNALRPVVTLIGLQIGALLGGAVITETIFAWPGVGRMTVQAIQGRDIPLVQASVIVLATIFVLTNLAVDLVYTVLDPRIRLR